MSSQLSLFGAQETGEVAAVAVSPSDADVAARAYAVDPRNNVVLEASAGTGKTSVLVSRYVNLLKAGVEPANILAITFTRKAAAEMRERIVRELGAAAARSEFGKARWMELRDRFGEIAIGTIDAFCLSLLREFPLEADIDPGFDIADETEVPRLMDEALDRALRIIVGLARSEPDLALVLAQLGLGRTREGLAALVNRRLVARDALNRFLAKGPADLTAEVICRRTAEALRDALRTVPGGLERFLADGPASHPRYQLFLRAVRQLRNAEGATNAEIRALLDGIIGHFLTNGARARKAGTAIPPYKPDHYPSKDAAKQHRDAVCQIAPHVERIAYAFNRDLNVVLARGIRRMFAIALEQYRRALDERSVLDFSDVLQRALELLRRMDEFSQSRFRLESRYHHVLVDEFQDTSRAQWELVSLLVQAWGEGLGVATQPSIFIVGDRKQSIYRFRDAEVAVLLDAGRQIEALRPGAGARRSIARSFRAVPELLAFVNELFSEIGVTATRPAEFSYGEADRFPIDGPPHDRIDLSPSFRGFALGISAADTAEACAAAVAEEIRRILRDDTIRDRKSGLARPAAPGDIAILFRSRTSHREFEAALEERGVPAYVYKGLGFFDADEIKDLTALVRYLANPRSDLRAAAFLRSRFVRLSDEGLAVLAPRLAAALTEGEFPEPAAQLSAEDHRVLEHTRRHLVGWLSSVDRLPPADLIEQILGDSAYAYELRGRRRLQAWENVKKMRGLIRRIQNRGYATLTRIADHIDALTPGDESNAALEALNAVNLMTVHASKGLEFPIVFVVNLAKGASGPPQPVRVIVDGEEDASVTVGPFVSEMEEADRELDKHETRRLLYVALTRARDRLYLSSVLKDGVLVPGRGSLAEVVPDSFKEFFGRAALRDDVPGRLVWKSASGRTFEWRHCPPSDATGSQIASTGVVLETAVSDPPADDFSPADRTARLRTPVTRWLHDESEDDSHERGAPTTDLLVGTLVHRLFEHRRGEDSGPTGELVAVAKGFVRPEERAGVEDLDRVAAAAVDAWTRIRGHDQVAALFAGGRCLHEVPFSLAVAGTEPPLVVRGTIDCLVSKPDGSFTVLELKTGGRRRSHQRQLDLYVEAARACFPGAPVDGLLVYA